jgi:hypothetical protein
MRPLRVCEFRVAHSLCQLAAASVGSHPRLQWDMGHGLQILERSQKGRDCLRDNSHAKPAKSTSVDAWSPNGEISPPQCSVSVRCRGLVIIIRAPSIISVGDARAEL